MCFLALILPSKLTARCQADRLDVEEPDFILPFGKWLGPPQFEPAANKLMAAP